MSIDRRGVLALAALASGSMLKVEEATAAATTSAASIALIEPSCSKIVTRFFDRLDALNRMRGTAHAGQPIAVPTEDEDPWALMTIDGTWRRNAATIDSRKAWDKAIGELPPGLVTAHLVCNLIVDASSGGATATFRLLIFSATSDQGAIPVKLGSPGAILTARAELVQMSEGWRIRMMASDAVFHF